VNTGFIGSLKVKEIAAEGETPLAGGGDVMTGAAWVKGSDICTMVRDNNPREKQRI
jgi:hypothetical protein